MKQLLIMRHAKASSEDPALADFERPLTERGKKDAAEMGQRLVQKFIPDQIVSSPAKRASRTAKIVAAQIGCDEKNIDKQADIYEASVEDLLYVIRNLDDRYEKVMLVGHNPGFTALICNIGDRIIDHLPTAGQALVQLDVLTWKQVTGRSGKLLWTDHPKNA